jgi:hypothetical protein
MRLRADALPAPTKNASRPNRSGTVGAEPLGPGAYVAGRGCGCCYYSRVQSGQRVRASAHQLWTLLRGIMRTARERSRARVHFNLE